MIHHITGRALAIGLLALAAACGRGGDDDAAPGGTARAADPVYADVIYHDGVIWTGTGPSGEDVRVLAVKDGRILAVGGPQVARAHAGPATDAVDLGGAFVTPGIIDAHTHFVGGGFNLLSVDLGGLTLKEDFIARIEEGAAALPEGVWLTARGWDHELWGGELPSRDWIDPVTGDRPVFVERLDGHMGLANTAALKAAGIDAETPNPDGGEIDRDAEGRATGVLRDNAMALVYRVQPAASLAQYDAAFEAAQAHALALGVTAVADIENFETLETYRRAEAEGRLKMRVDVSVPIRRWRDLAAFVAEHGEGTERIRWVGVKGYMDGSLGARTAKLAQPYADAPTDGLWVTPPEAMAAFVEDADAAGLQVNVHAIGDAANKVVLDAFEAAIAANGPREGRIFRVEHAQHLSPDLIPRFAEIGVVASMQPAHIADDGRWAESRIGAERAAYAYPFRSLLQADAHLAFGSDWPVAPLDPRVGVHAAVTRRPNDGSRPEGWVPAEKISVEEALFAYTAGAAASIGRAGEIGVLAPGAHADFVVWDRDLRRIPAEEILDVAVRRTVVAGETVYEAP